MPYLEINGCRLFYETFGSQQENQPPILLIHGSPDTGQHDWREIAPILAKDYFVIVPDCRGHGKSTNPQGGYSFKQMAKDFAALLFTIGFDCAHIIGHSNGGNIALVMLMEHPQVVQTAVLQAANAYVSQDLIDKEPAVFDPERVERENPAWRDHMISLHGEVHGVEYWRSLLKETAQEIITQPDYAPEELAQVKRPVLVFQGADDPVNSPGRHAQFIYRNIPFAELWLPENTGHHVHKERTSLWLEKILDFIHRRGDIVNEVIYRLMKCNFPDRRTTVFDLSYDQANKTLSGTVLDASQVTQAKKVLIEAGEVLDSQLKFDVNILSSHAQPAMVIRGVTDLRREPSNRAERLTQALLGEAVYILDEKENWAWVQMEKDDYIGWTHLPALLPCDQIKITAYQQECSLLVCGITSQAFVGDDPPDELQPELSDYSLKIPFGVPLVHRSERQTWTQVQLPDESLRWIKTADLLPINQRPQANPEGVQRTLAYIYKFVGTPYLWGGRTAFGTDCSGFSQTFLGFLGISIPRDADQQFRHGREVTDLPQPGDLLFFGENDDDEKERFKNISHVAISLGGHEIIHSNGTAWGVSYNSLDESHPCYREWLKSHLLGVRRYL